jgi:malate synthase
MVVTVEDMHGLLPAIDTETLDTSRCDLPDNPRSPVAATTDTITRARFLDHIDSCVRHLAALLGGPPAAANHDAVGGLAAENARVQLWHWLHGGDALLDDGTPIDFALFDTAIQRVAERLPRRGLPGQENVLQAAWLLAELTHARTLTEAALVPALARTL